jgi:DamX protein
MTDKEDIFSTSESEARLDLIRHLIENSELVPLVRGVSGIGKSLLASRLQAGAPDNWVVCLFEADSMMQPEKLLAHIARCNGLPDAKDENIRRLVERFEQMRKRGSIPVLLIDDAQRLPPTSLITLLRLYERQVGGGPLLSLVLFADEQIDMLLSTPQLQIMSPQSIQVIDLPPLTREEADSYMNYILRQEGLDLNLRLDAGRMNRLYRDTGGAPGPLGSAIRKEVGDSGGMPVSSGFKLSGPLLWAGLPLLGLLLLALLFQGPINRLFAPEPVSSDETLIADNTPADSLVPQALEPTSSPPPAIVLPPPGQAEQAPMPAVDPGTTAENESVVPPGRPLAGLAEPPAASTKLPEMAADSPPPVSAPMPQAVAKAAAVGAPVTESVAKPVGSAVEAVPSRESESEDAAPAGSQATPDISAPESPPLQQAATQALSPQAQTSAGGDAGESQSRLLRSRDWLAEQAQGSYTLQLLAVGSIESVESAVKRFGLKEKAFCIKGARGGRPWYPLLWGVYPDRKAAQAAIKRLPTELQKSGVWARSLASLVR